MNILIVVAHPDDEVLGMGGTIKKLSKQKNKIHLCMVSDGAAAVKDKKSLIAKRKEACYIFIISGSQPLLVLICLSI